MQTEPEQWVVELWAAMARAEFLTALDAVRGKQ